MSYHVRLFLPVLAAALLCACSSPVPAASSTPAEVSVSSTSSAASVDEANTERMIEGEILDGTMNTLTIRTATGETLAFSTVDADKTGCNGLIIGTTARVYYTGTFGELSGSDTSGITVTRIEQDADSAFSKTLYIGHAPDLKEYPHTFASEPTPDMFIAAIAEKTGWNLSLSEPVSTGKGGMTVVFSKDSAIFTGPPEEQKDEFHVFEPSGLIYSILDSIQKTLQMNYVDPALGDPSKLDVYFAVEGDQPISFPDLDVNIPMDQPYSASTK